MANHLPKQPPNLVKCKDYKSFSDTVKHYLEVKGMSRSDFKKASALPKTTVSRIWRNTNDKGSSYMPDLHCVMAISIGLKLTREEAEELLFSAFPEMAVWGRFLDKRLSIDQVNEILYDNGLPLLGNGEE